LPRGTPGPAPQARPGSQGGPSFAQAPRLGFRDDFPPVGDANRLGVDITADLDLQVVPVLDEVQGIVTAFFKHGGMLPLRSMPRQCRRMTAACHEARPLIAPAPVEST